MTAAGPQARVAASLAACVPELDGHAAHGILTAASADRGRSLRELEDCLREHFDALAVTPARYPLALVLIAHALIEAGHQAVTAPACAGCGTATTDLRRLTAAGRVCSACAARRSRGECARCGQVRRINARRPEGGICSACYARDEQVLEDCSGCDRRRPAARWQRSLPALR